MGGESTGDVPDTGRRRRPPPPLRLASVESKRELSHALIEVVLAGAGLVGFDRPEPGASLRMVLPRSGAGSPLELPTWRGNEYLFDDGERPAVRTLTPLDVDPAEGRLTVWLVRGHDGTLARWASDVTSGEEVAISGPGSGYRVDHGTQHLVVLGDLAAAAAVHDVIERAPAGCEVRTLVECSAANAPDTMRHRDDVEWLDPRDGAPPGSALVDRVRTLLASVDGHGPARPDAITTRWWAAGEAASIQRLRTLFAESGVPRHHTHVRGYWRQGRPQPGDRRRP
ncbi:MAG: siderophore-interacting protein [Microthrixaceae bacterium]